MTIHRTLTRTPWTWLAPTLVGFLGLALMGFGLILTAHQASFVLDGAQVAASVTAKSMSSGRVVLYTVDYQFSVPGSRPVTGSDTIDSGQWRRLNVGDPITVEYVRSDPAVNRVPGGQPLVQLLLAFLAGAAFTLVAAGATASLLSERPRRQRPGDPVATR